MSSCKTFHHTKSSLFVFKGLKETSYVQSHHNKTVTLKIKDLDVKEPTDRLKAVLFLAEDEIAATYIGDVSWSYLLKDFLSKVIQPIFHPLAIVMFS